MDIKKYLERIRFEGSPGAELETLKKLHLHHLLSVPFENLDIHEGSKIILEPERLFHKIVEKKRGGFCYEMNGLFYEVLTAIGFDAKRVSARVYDNPEEAGPEFDHMAIIVNIDGEEWLADVGFGDSFLEPLKLQPGPEQRQYGKIFKILRLDGNDYKTAFSRDGKSYSDMYRFSTIPRELSEYAEMCEYHQTSPKSHFTRNTICSLARTNGRISLRGNRLIETIDGAKAETDLDGDSEVVSKLKELFGIVL